VEQAFQPADSLERLFHNHEGGCQKMLDYYYEKRGWDANGIPTPETLARLGLADLVGR